MAPSLSWRRKGGFPELWGGGQGSGSGPGSVLVTCGVLADPFISSDQLISDQRGSARLCRSKQTAGELQTMELLQLCTLLLLLQREASSLVLGALRHPVPVLWMMPASSGPGPENTTAVVAPAVLQALQDLQRQPPPLGNYQFQLQPLHVQVGCG